MTATNPTSSNQLTRERGLVIVAHPDDEVIWCGGMILQSPEIEWTVIALCRGSDPDRRPRFEAAATALGATGIIMDIDDSPVLLPLKLSTDIIHPLKSELLSNSWQVCLTHGATGEYGHQRHIDAHQAVCMMLRSKELQCEKYYFFAYQKNDNDTIANTPDADLYYRLNPLIFEQKRAIVRDIYGFNKSSFEWNACLAVESFNSIS